MAIIDYLEEQFPKPPLLPGTRDPWRRGRARQLAEMINAGIQPYQNLSLLHFLRDCGLADPEARRARAQRARAWPPSSSWRGETAGQFLVGDTPTLADVYLIPQLYGARRFKVDLAPYPKLLRAEASARRCPRSRRPAPSARPTRPLANP